MLKSILEVMAALLGLAGTIVGSYGTYLLTRWSLPFRFWGIVRRMWEILWKLVTLQKDEVIKKLRFESDFTKFLNEENKGYSLYGAYLVFIGFVLQIFGAFFAALSVIRAMILSS
jgi:hypothetical protein